MPEPSLSDFEPEISSHVAFHVALVAGAWSLFQIWIASPLPFILEFGIVHGVRARAIHLGFAFAMTYFLYRATKTRRGAKAGWPDYLLLACGVLPCLYILVFYEGIVERVGVLLNVSVGGVEVPVEMIVGGIGLIALLEAARRAVGLPLVVISLLFLIYSLFGQSMPELISHRGMSLERLIGYHWWGGEAIFGLPLDVVTSFVFMFVLFGALLDTAGAGKYFLDLAFALVGKFRGGPAKAAILASGLTGMISGSSIANVVTTGTFTIPVMRKVGLPAVKAGAIEVAASVNGQLMPPIMGAAAFIMAELIGISYFDVIYHAFLPAVITYLALFWISHLEALKLDLRPMAAEDIPQLRKTFLRGVHYFLPIVVLVWLLMVERMSASAAVFWATLSLMLIIAFENLKRAVFGEMTPAHALHRTGAELWQGLVGGGRNMASVSVAVACAGIIVGAVGSTGLNNALIGIVEAISGGNVYMLLGLTAVLCLLLGMGLPTTANYLVVASLMAPVLVELGQAAGLILPLIVVHLYVFYFGLMADVTPPVGLAAYAAAAISRADPIRTGIQAFFYEIRTAILPVVFVFNNQLLLIGVESWAEGIFVFVTSLLAIMCFASATQGFLFRRLHFIEIVVLLALCLALFRPGALLSLVYPQWRAVPIVEVDRTLAAATAPGSMRIAVTRSTNYGERYRLMIFAPEEIEGASSLTLLGLTVSVDEAGRGGEVSDIGFMSAAEQKGFQFADRVTAIEFEVLDRPSKHIVSVIALILLGGLTFANVWTRPIRRRLPDQEAGAP